MGIVGAHELSHSLKGLSIEDIYNFCSYNRQQREDASQPTIDLDASLIYRGSKLSVDNRMRQLMDICCQFASVGFIVVVVCDGPVRHHTKRASVQRQSVNFGNKVQSYLLRVQLMSTVELKNQAVDVAEKTRLEVEENIVSSDLKNLERKLQYGNVDVGQKFFAAIEQHITKLTASDLGKKGGVVKVIQAEYQADSVMACRHVNKHSDIVLSSDSDLLAHCGKDCVGIKTYNYTIRGKKAGIDNIEIFTADATMLDNILVALRKPLHNNSNIKRSKHPIFEGISCPKIRALLAVGLGCDVYNKGVRGISKVILKEWLDRNNIENENTTTLYNKILAFYAQRSSCDNTRTKRMTHTKVMSNEERIVLYASLNTLVESFIYEPCNYVVTSTQLHDKNNLPIYIHSTAPSTLHMYNREFAKGDTSISIHGSNVDICTCVGIGNGPHCFLVYEGISNCYLCDATCCQFCSFDISSTNNVQQHYCSECYLRTKFIPTESIGDHVPVEDMISKLHNVGIEVSKDENMDVLMALYDHNINKNEVIFKEEELKGCSMPYENAEYLSNQETIVKYNLMEGGMIIRNPLLSSKDQLDLLSLIATLVTVKPNKNNRLHAAVPYFLVESAKASRIRGGDRLLERALRHSVDNDRSDIYKADAKIIRYRDNIGIYLSTTVRASMKRAEYKVAVSFFEKGIISNTCTCKVGCLGIERIICIHILPVIQQYSVEIFRALAADFLYCFNQQWDPLMESTINESDLKNLTANICILIRACNLQTPNAYNDQQTLSQLLRQFDTGTEQRKVGPGPPINKTKLGPLRVIKFVNPVIVTEKNKQQVLPEPDLPVPDLLYTDLQPKQLIPYSKILNIIKFIREHFRKDDTSLFDECVGYWLLALRASTTSTFFSILDTDTKKQISKLLDAGNQELRPPRLRRKILVGGDYCRVISNTEDSIPVPEPQQGIDYDVNGEEDDVVSENSNINISNVVNEEENVAVLEKTNININNAKAKRNKKQYHRCCIPSCTQRNDNTFLRRLPACPPKNLNKATDQVRMTYAVKSYKRKEWLRRWHLQESKCPSYVLHCNHHEFEDTSVEIKWRSNDGVDKIKNVTILLPREDNVNTVLTRTDSMKRKAVVPVRIHAAKRVRENEPSTTEDIPIKKFPHRWCCYVNCNVNSSMPGSSFCRVPPIPKHSPTELWRNSMRFNYAKKIEYRAEFLRRIGTTPNDERKDIRICNNHQVDRVVKSITYKTTTGTKTATIEINVPSAYTVKSNLNQHSEIKHRFNKGNAYNRFESNYVAQSAECAKTKIGYDWAYSYFQTMEYNDGDINNSNRGRSLTDINTQTNMNATINTRVPVYGIVNRERKEARVREKSIIKIATHSDRVLKACTGFRCMSSMLAFICIICDGSVELMGKTTSSLTWIEEWHLYFERVYGRSCKRMVDCSIKYRVGITVLRRVFKEKLAAVRSARSRWPMFASFSEDALLRNDRWNTTYSGRRIVMWDNTDIPLATPSHPNLQKNTYSDYYAGNVGKGSVFVQLCGWLGTHEIWEGAVTDTDYFRRSGILQLQQQYVELYDTDDASHKWINVLDRGYKVVGDCYANGGQHCLQPTFSRSSDPKFSTTDTQLTAAVAADRAANERAVRISKLSKYISDGYKQTVSVEQLCDVWLCWSFQANFIYKPVL